MIRWGMFIETIPNRTSPPAILLRESYRDEAGKPCKRTLANLSKLPAAVIEGIRGLLKGGMVVRPGEDGLQIKRSLPHGHVTAALGVIRKIALDRLILSTATDDASRRYCDLVVGMIVDRLIKPRSKAGFVRAVNANSALTSLGDVLGLGTVSDREAYEALDWLAEERARKRKVLLDATEKELTRIKARVRPTPPVVTGTGKSPHLYAAADIGVAVGAVLDGPNERTVPICAISGHNKNVNLSGNHGKHPLVGFRTTALSGMVCRTVSRGLFV